MLDVSSTMDLIELRCLTSLCLDQCEGIFKILGRNGVNAADCFGWTPNLKAFSLKAMSWGHNEHRGLEAFFASFTGLKHIAILIQAGGITYWPGKLLDNHCRSLKSLVWEHNFAARTRNGTLSNNYRLKNKSRRDFSFLDHVCKVCPNLRELGIALPISTHNWRYKVLFIIST